MYIMGEIYQIHNLPRYLFLRGSKTLVEIHKLATNCGGVCSHRYNIILLHIFNTVVKTIPTREKYSN